MSFPLKARKLLSDWSELKEVFKIPKRELVKMRAEHEREADRAAMARSSFSARWVLNIVKCFLNLFSNRKCHFELIPGQM